MSFITEKHSHGVSQAVLFALMALTAFLVVLTYNNLVAGPETNESEPAHTITVSGDGDVLAVADTAEFTFSVQNSADTVEAAQQSVTQTMNKILSQLKSTVSKKDLKTVGYRISPQYNYLDSDSISVRQDNRVLVGYIVEHRVRVEVEKINKAGKLLSLVGQLGADSVSSLSFTVDNLEALKAQARGEAINDAQKAAARLAEQLGVEIVGVVSFSADSYDRGPILYKAMSLAAGSAAAETAAVPTIPTGQNKITSQVQITYEIR